MGIFTRRRRWRSPKRRKPESTRESGRRLLALYLAMAVVFGALVVRLLYMQVLGGSEYRLRAEGNRIRVETKTPYRGLIFDRNGRQLVDNVPVWTVGVVPAELPKEREREVFDALQALLGVPVYQIEQKVRAGHEADPHAAVELKTEVDPQTALILMERRQSLPGVQAEYDRTRVYQFGGVMGHILGYTGKMSEEEVADFGLRGYAVFERVGKAGLELEYESQLRGSPGRRQVEVDASGKEIREVAAEPARPGANLVLSIDADLQQATYDILKDSIAGTGANKAVAVVMDVHTGEILASASIPTYDNNIFSHQVDDAAIEKLLTDPNKPLLDHAIAEKFAPGSTFKQVTGIAALQEGIATPQTTIVSQGQLSVPKDFDPTAPPDIFPDWHPNLGALDFYRGVAMSSDVYFYCLAGGHCPTVPDGLGSLQIARYARMFGFGEPTGIDLPGETEGLIGDSEWLSRVTKGEQQWYTGDTFNMGIGQGYVEATPLQVLRLTVTIANGGTLLRPKVVREIRDADGNVIVPAGPEVIRRVAVDPRNLQVMRDAMRMSVTQGTANRAAVPGVAIAAKTGTAEFGVRLGAGSVYGRYKEHGWTVAFGPYENPEVAVVVFQEEGSGATTAAPTAGKILDYYFNQMPKLTRATP
ncbi:MAG: penicillin-binding protein 2 [Dehalococcoidia bacterium]